MKLPPIPRRSQLNIKIKLNKFIFLEVFGDLVGLTFWKTFFLELNFSYISSLYLLECFLLITARKICQVGLWKLLYLCVVYQATLDKKRRKLSLSYYTNLQLFEIVFRSFPLYGCSNKLLPKPLPGKEKETRKKRPTKLRTSKNFCLVLEKTVETHEGGQSTEPYFIKRQSANDISGEF